MAAQREDHQMEGVDSPAQIADKGKAKATEATEESADDDSSDESGNEADTPDAEPEDDDTMAEIDPTNIVGSRTRGKNIDFAKAAQELGEDEDEDDDEDFNDPDDEMKD
ncbi:histone chaperone domain chz [Paraphaeosphaeria minitans]|uniref:Histone chaperone domain chz n=1 Tax=Paraphaeosphaeria minitans TaxID=565426 RepID=A0A9P6GBI5_9PLEO|nr:histone chaperone domain chz [Paraphaeosphaeria minitans]